MTIAKRKKGLPTKKNEKSTTARKDFAKKSKDYFLKYPFKNFEE
jgi:hypothetical protein